jgi:hypothetical protein
MDSDDTIDEANGRGLRALAYQSAPAELLGHVIAVHCPSSDPDDPSGFTRVTHVKLFRNLSCLRFEHRIHEQILPAIQRAGGTVAFTPLFVVHSGYDTSPEGQKRKMERDLRLLHLELREQPDHPFTLFNLGMTYVDAGQHRDAIAFLRRCLERSSAGTAHLRKAYGYLVACHDALGESEAAWAACEQGLAAFPLDAELRFRRGNLLQGRGQLREAIAAYQDVLDRHEEQHYTSVVEGVSGYLARYNMALAYRRLGEGDQAEAQLRRVLEEVPGYALAQQGLEELHRLRSP